MNSKYDRGKSSTVLSVVLGNKLQERQELNGGYNMKKCKYTIRLQGCDDSTEFNVELGQREYNLVRKIMDKSKVVSNCICQPRLIVTPVGLHTLEV